MSTARQHLMIHGAVVALLTGTGCSCERASDELVTTSLDEPAPADAARGSSDVSVWDAAEPPVSSRRDASLPRDAARPIPAVTDAITDASVSPLPDLESGPAPPDTFPRDDATAGLEAGSTPTSADPLWRWENPQPFGVSLLASWAFGPTEVWVSGELGAVGHWDGAQWVTEWLPNQPTVYGLWGFASDELWAASSNGVWRWNGARWSREWETEAAVRAIWGVSNERALAGGSELAYRDALGWVTQAPAPFGEIQSLWATELQDVWAVAAEPGGPGSGGTAFVGPGRLFRFDGQDWEEVPIELPELTEVSVVSVSGTATDDVWALVQGVDGFSVVQRALRFDGEGWTQYPAGSGDARQILAVPGAAVWVLGGNGSVFTAEVDEFIAQPVPFAFATALALSASAEGDVTAVGRSGLVSRWDAGSWVELSQGARAAIENLVVTGASLFAVGTGSTNSIGEPDTHVGPVPLLSGSSSEQLPPTVVDAWGTSENELWAIGRNTIHHYAGAWSTVDDSGAGHRAIWGSAPDDIWVVGDRTLWRWDGTNWDKQTRNVADVDGSAADDVWLVIGETATHFDGASWIDHNLPGLNALAVHATTEGAVVAGEGGAAVYAGGQWSVTALDADLTALAVYGDEFWAVGQQGLGADSSGAVFRYADGQWQQHSSPVDVGLRAVVVHGERLWIAAHGGVVLSRALP